MMEYGLLSGSGSSVANAFSDSFQSLTRLGGELWQLALDNPVQSAAFILLVLGVGWFLQRR